MGPLATADFAQIKHHFDVNVFSTIKLAQAALPHLRKTRGNMLFVSSGAATSAYSGWGAYCASKAALNSIAAVMAVEEPNVTSIAIRPGVLDTDMQKLIREHGKGKMNSEQHEKFINLHSQGQLTPPDVSAHVLAALCFSPPAELSGRFLDWQAPELAAYQKKAC